MDVREITVRQLDVHAGHAGAAGIGGGAADAVEQDDKAAAMRKVRIEIAVPAAGDVQVHGHIGDNVRLRYGQIEGEGHPVRIIIGNRLGAAPIGGNSSRPCFGDGGSNSQQHGQKKRRGPGKLKVRFHFQ
jgi:hypothetical protein